MNIKNVVMRQAKFEKNQLGNFYWDFVIGFKVDGHKASYNALLKLDKDIDVDLVLFDGIEIAESSLENDITAINQLQQVVDGGYEILQYIINENKALQLSTLFVQLEMAQFKGTINS